MDEQNQKTTSQHVNDAISLLMTSSVVCHHTLFVTSEPFIAQFTLAFCHPISEALQRPSLMRCDDERLGGVSNLGKLGMPQGRLLATSTQLGMEVITSSLRDDRSHGIHVLGSSVLLAATAVDRSLEHVHCYMGRARILDEAVGRRIRQLGGIRRGEEVGSHQEAREHEVAIDTDPVPSRNSPDEEIDHDSRGAEESHNHGEDDDRSHQQEDSHDDRAENESDSVRYVGAPLESATRGQYKTGYQA